MRNHSTEYKNQMFTIVALFFIITVYHTGHTQKIPEECINLTNMDASKRKTALEQHNWKRYFLAGGYPFPDRLRVRYPSASDMNVLYYDCDLENDAHEIARECGNSSPDFDYVGSNNATLEFAEYDSDFITTIIEKWWETALQGRKLVNLTPSQENKPMIPFLQMANGKINKLGCAYQICDVGFFDEPTVLFVCKYGEPKIRVGNPIYTRGEPCGSCRNRCTFNNRLCATDTRH